MQSLDPTGPAVTEGEGSERAVAPGEGERRAQRGYTHQYNAAAAPSTTDSIAAT